MRNFNPRGGSRDGSRFGGGSRGGFGGRGGYRGGRGGGDDRRGPIVMHSAICDECQKSCQVPFRPTGDKPIYCSECFEAKGGKSGSDRSFDRSDRGNNRGSDFGHDSMHGAKRQDARRENFENKLEQIITKLDILIKAISPDSQVKVKMEVDSAVEEKVEKTPKARAKTPKAKVVKK